jgi:hypothetical protein
VIPVLERLRQDRELAGQADDALGEITMFLRPLAADL